LKALILAAGLGTRLMPLTASTPKVLVKINGMTLLEIAIRKLASEGFNEIIVNVHHHAEQVVKYLEKCRFDNIDIAISDEREELLDTGGAILKAMWFLDGNEPFLVHNVDVISNIDLRSMLAEHLRSGGLATLSVLDRSTKRYFLFDDRLRLNGWTDTSTGEFRWASLSLKYSKKLAFSGIHIINPAIFNLITQSERFSIVQTYIELAAKHPIFGYVQPEMTWFDLGKPDQLDKVSAFIKEHPEFIKTI
jgi:NDP-sugar pyrophosphorylase family protein